MLIQTHLHGPQPTQDQPGFHRRSYPAEQISQLFETAIGRVVVCDEHSAKHIAVPAHILCCSVHHDIDTQLQRLLIERRTIGIVYVSRNVVCFCICCDRLQIDQGKGVASGTFQDDQTGVLLDRSQKLLGIISMHERITHLHDRF